MSQPPYQPAPYAPPGPYAPLPSVPAPPAPRPAAAGPAVPPPAAPTQVGYPGQVQLPPQPRYAPPGALASGFPDYRSPAPSPVNRTGLYVGTLVCLLTILFAVVGFALVA
ncbi:Wiskott-Aldrich syndrome protein [Geodermatophilus telluris]|uniref:Wiskott-Aldrich syndrome protein n=1 Tax=Geodermatophilus telluris TaxID=1190417 RepID=A0A1G6QQC7_9ACTN|nr:hypothetical protein [Geodermatophilus telluris]SDC93867.1 Wiskott-Aldrich syndrome protein [Geodermatophilus telluris]